MITLPVNLGAAHTQVIYQNKKQVINDKINIYNQTGILCLYEDTG